MKVGVQVNNIGRQNNSIFSEHLKMSEIKTLVNFDLEAAGLKNSGRPRISEI